jgi:hypothetical protein
MDTDELQVLEDFVKECQWQTDGNWRIMSWDINNYSGDSHCWIFIDGRYLLDNFDNENDVIAYEYILSVLETGLVTILIRIMVVFLLVLNLRVNCQILISLIILSRLWIRFMATELNSLDVFMGDYGFGLGSWLACKDGGFRASIFVEPFKGIGTPRMGILYYKDNIVRLSTSVNYSPRYQELFECELCDPLFFDDFGVALDRFKENIKNGI